MKKTYLAFASTLAILAVATSPSLHAQTRPDESRAVPKMLERPQLKSLAEPDLSPGARITAYELVRRDAEPASVARRLAGALNVLLDTETAARLAAQGALERVAKGEDAGGWVRIDGTPVLARYQAEYDEIRLIHEELDVVSDVGQDLGEDRVRQVAESYLKRLGESGAIDPRLYAEAAMQLGYKMVGEGSVEEAVQPGRIVEYRITYRPRLKGIEMANAGLRLGILTSGQLASLRVGGVTPVGKWEEGVLQSTAPDSVRTIRVSTKELMDRFYKGAAEEHSEARVAWSRVMYVMPEGESQAIVEPMLIISHSRTGQIEGHTVVSRRKTLGYSLTDPRAEVLDFDAPAREHDETRVTREEHGKER